MRFMQDADKKRAMVSRLLQRRACFEAFGVPYDKVQIERTKGGKPFMSNKPKPAPADAPHWNYNVSHEGRFVTLVSEPLAVCGVDVAAPGKVRDKKPRPMMEQLRIMDNQLTDAEKRLILSARPDEKAMEAYFRRLWSLKEAYTKGRGDGLGFPFNRCEFGLGGVGRGTAGQPVQAAAVTVDGKPRPLWHFFVQELEDEYWISVARGPCEDIVDAHGGFTASLGHAASGATDAARLLAQLEAPEPPFVRKTIAELVSDDRRAEYEAVCARRPERS